MVKLKDVWRWIKKAVYLDLIIFITGTVIFLVFELNEAGIIDLVQSGDYGQLTIYVILGILLSIIIKGWAIEYVNKKVKK